MNYSYEKHRNIVLLPQEVARHLLHISWFCQQRRRRELLHVLFQPYLQCALWIFLLQYYEKKYGGRTMRKDPFFRSVNFFFKKSLNIFNLLNSYITITIKALAHASTPEKELCFHQPSLSCLLPMLPVLANLSCTFFVMLPLLQHFL